MSLKTIYPSIDIFRFYFNIESSQHFRGAKDSRSRVDHTAAICRETKTFYTSCPYVHTPLCPYETLRQIILGEEILVAISMV